MKPIWAYTLILLYLLVAMRPFVPTVSYYLQQNYFAEELCQFKSVPKNCCKGSCQLGQMAKEATEGSGQSGQTRLIAEELLVVLVQDLQTAFSISAIEKPKCFRNASPILVEATHDIWHPPTIVA